MDKKKWPRILAIILVIACLAGTVAAAAVDGISKLDINRDGITNIWDAQAVLFDNSRNDAQKNIFLEGIKGKILGITTVDTQIELQEDAYLIDSALDLYQLAAMTSEETHGKTFLLTADIDLKGANWTPIVGFAGTFNGQGYTISNFTVDKCVANYTAAADYANHRNIGFFGDNTTASTIKALNLENFTIDASNTNATYVGTLIGSNRGKISACFVDGKLVDSRQYVTEDTTDTIYRGLLAGRITKGSGGTVTLATRITKAYDGDTAGAAVNAVMALELYGDTDSQTPFVGWMEAPVVTGLWRDTTYGSAWLTENEQARRQTVVDYMRQMGTVQWTPSEDFIYLTNKGLHDAQASADPTYITHIHNNLYEAGRTYTGLPYNFNFGTYERFMTQVTGEENGVYQIGTVEDSFNNNDGEDGSISGFAQYMGNNCSAAVVWAWSRVSHSRHKSASSLLPYNGFRGLRTYSMTPCTRIAGTTDGEELSYTDYYGVYPVGWTPIDTRDTKTIINSMDGSLDDTLSEADYLGMAECYAQSKPGDALAYGVYTEGDVATSSAHIRMIAYDPVVIRASADGGSIDLVRSYFVTHEQGDGLFNSKVGTGTHTYDNVEYTFDIKTTSWRIDHKYTFELLLKGTLDGVKQASSVRGCGPCYVPVTMQAFTFDAGTNYAGTPGEDDGLYVDSARVDAVYLLKDIQTKESYTSYAPDQGAIYTHYKPISSTLTILDETGTEALYQETRYIGVSGGDSTLPSEFRGNFLTVYMSKVHGGYDTRANETETLLEEGGTYCYTYELLLSNGRRVTLAEMNNNGGNATLSFTYTPGATSVPGTPDADDTIEDSENVEEGSTVE